MRNPYLSRRELLERGAAVAFASVPLIAAGGFAPSPPSVATQDPAGIVRQPDEGELLISGRRRAPIRIKIDSARARGVAMSMVVSEVLPETTIPVHRHRHEDELIFIHAGQGILTLGDQTHRVAAGAMLYGPRGVWHGIENPHPAPLIWCAIYAPAGFEQFFKEVGVQPGAEARLPPAAVVNEIALKYGLEFRNG